MLWQIFGLLCLAGNVFHFLYAPLGRPRYFRWLLPVNESPWEHTKLCFWPLGAGLAFTGWLWSRPWQAVLLAWLAAGGHSVITMLSVYYLYRSALGVERPVLWVDIGNFFLTMLCAWPIGLGLLSGDPGPGVGALCALALLAAGVIYQRASARPYLQYPMFREEHSNGRDQRTRSS